MKAKTGTTPSEADIYFALFLSKTLDLCSNRPEVVIHRVAKYYYEANVQDYKNMIDTCVMCN